MTILCVCCQSCLFPPTIDVILQLMIPFHHEWRKHCFTCVYHDIIRDNYMWEVGERAVGGGGEGRRRCCAPISLLHFVVGCYHGDTSILL